MAARPETPPPALDCAEAGVVEEMGAEEMPALSAEADVRSVVIDEDEEVGAAGHPVFWTQTRQGNGLGKNEE